VTRETSQENIIDVEWNSVPVSEPVLPGDTSAKTRAEKGWSIWNPALVSVITGLNNTIQAQRLLAAGAVKIDGRPAMEAFDYIKPGAIVEVEGHGVYRLGPRMPEAWRNRRRKPD
jgi:hypothetical protein